MISSNSTGELSERRAVPSSRMQGNNGAVGQESHRIVLDCHPMALLYENWTPWVEWCNEKHSRKGIVCVSSARLLYVWWTNGWKTTFEHVFRATGPTKVKSSHPKIPKAWGYQHEVQKSFTSKTEDFVQVTSTGFFHSNWPISLVSYIVSYMRNKIPLLWPIARTLRGN